ILLAHRTLRCCFWGKGHMSLIECLQSWIDVGKTPFPSGFERLPFGSQEKGFPDFDTHGHLGTKALWYGKTNLFLCPLLPFHLSGRLVKSC
uniref:Uncharacterized protein n=1 Tax=Colobus angolensis palliatus TaxID=336983 RepID=A0A2K5HSD2_COLAP